MYRSHIIQRQVPAAHRGFELLMAGDEAETVNAKRVAAGARQRADHIPVHSLNDRNYGDDCRDADDYAQQSQERAQFVCPERLIYKREDFKKRHGYTGCVAVTGAVFGTSSRSIFPSRRWMTLRALAATSGSCVTMMMVFPL